MSFRATTALAAAAALALLATGCGVGATDEGEVSATTGRYLSALADGDYAKACVELAEAARPAGDCPDGVASSVSGIPADTIAADDDGKSELAVDGDAATVTFESGRTIELARIGETWLVTSPYAP